MCKHTNLWVCLKMLPELLTLVSVGSEELFGPLACNFWRAVAKGRSRFHPHLGSKPEVGD